MNMRCRKCNAPARITWDGCCSSHRSDDITYCSSRCLKDDWFRDKEYCRQAWEEANLEIIGAVLQGVYYIYRQRFFDHRVVGSRDKSQRGLPNVVEFDFESDEAHGEAIFHRFPDGDQIANVRHRKILLASDGCNVARAVCRAPLRSLLGSEYRIDELNYVVEHPSTEVVWHSAHIEKKFRTVATNWIFRVKEDDRTSFAIDLTGTQFGFAEASVETWSQHLLDRQVHVNDIINELREAEVEPYRDVHTRIYGQGASVSARCDIEERAIEAIKNIFATFEVHEVHISDAFWDRHISFQAVSDEVFRQIRIDLQSLWDEAHSHTGRLSSNGHSSILRQ